MTRRVPSVKRSNMHTNPSPARETITAKINKLLMTQFDARPARPRSRQLQHQADLGTIIPRAVTVEEIESAGGDQRRTSSITPCSQTNKQTSDQLRDGAQPS